MGWDDLAADQHSAAEFLGYTESIWNNDQDSSASEEEQQQQASFDARYAELEWADLESEQQTAFAYLGYGEGSYSDFYDDYFFAELPLHAQVAAYAVGYTQDVWDNCTAEICSAQVDDRRWQGLSRVQRTNLKILGYDCWVWNNYDFSGGAQTDTPVWQETVPPTYLGPPPATNCNVPPAWADDEMGWDDLAADQHSAAEFLGYTESIWNEDQENDGNGSQGEQQASFDARAYYADVEWADLILAQRAAFAYLGHSKGSYSGFYDDYYFAELPPQVQAAANAVGYTQDVWDNCAAEICSAQVDSSMWQGLSGVQRVHLKILGYNCWVWNNYE